MVGFHNRLIRFKKTEAGRGARGVAVLSCCTARQTDEAVVQPPPKKKGREPQSPVKSHFFFSVGPRLKRAAPPFKRRKRNVNDQRVNRTEHNQKSVHKHVGPFGGRSLSAALRAVCQAKQPHAAAAVPFALRRHSAGQWSPRELPVACVWRLVCGA
jgi:hypothetical protein